MVLPDRRSVEFYTSILQLCYEICDDLEKTEMKVEWMGHYGL